VITLVGISLPNPAVLVGRDFVGCVHCRISCFCASGSVGVLHRPTLHSVHLPGTPIIKLVIGPTDPAVPTDSDRQCVTTHIFRAKPKNGRL
jgi:hypothetical protein